MQEDVARVVVLRDVVRVVVVDLVIVPGHDPGERGVRRLQIRIGPVLRVAVAVVLERHDLRPGVIPHLRFVAAVLVDVVAEVKHEVERLF